jgi:hypothetical protein
VAELLEPFIVFCSGACVLLTHGHVHFSNVLIILLLVMLFHCLALWFFALSCTEKSILLASRTATAFVVVENEGGTQAMLVCAIFRVGIGLFDLGTGWNIPWGLPCAFLVWFGVLGLVVHLVKG